MDKLKIYFLLSIFLVICAKCLWAQPSPCSGEGLPTTLFDPLRSCDARYFSEEFVFVGRVISADLKTTEVKNHPAGFVKVNIAIETPIKGKPGQNIDLFLNRICYKYLERGEQRIFTARRLIEPAFDGIVSFHWSNSLKDISKNDLAEIVKDIRSVLRGTKQPRIAGRLIEYDSTNDGRYGFSGGYLMTKLGYDPKHGRPLVGIEITAVPVDWKRIPLNDRRPYKAKTKQDGSFKLKYLPAGLYVLSPALPDNFQIVTFNYPSRRVGEILYESGFVSVSERTNYVTVGDGFCSEDVRFNVRPLPPK